ncbi:MAG TPA: hypothetical protein VH988_25075 [Thermoanaerobaculia bacterium]|nr:hypothetical protein [Thermoanaerobaculia bacterium]
MNRDRLVFARALRKLALKAGKVLVRHPTSETLIAYDAGILSPEQAEQLREHFVHCRECPELLLDYQRFMAETAGGESPPDPESVAAWQELSRRSARWMPPRRRSAHRSALATARALCVLLVVALIALSVWVLALHREIRRLAEPQVNLPVLPVESRTAPERGSAGWLRRIVVPAATERFLLVLVPRAVRPNAEYRLDLCAADGRSLWSADRLTKGADGSFALGLSRRFLPGGEYRIRLLENVQGRTALIEEFPVLLFYSPSPPAGKS